MRPQAYLLLKTITDNPLNTSTTVMLTRLTVDRVKPWLKHIV